MAPSTSEHNLRYDMQMASWCKLFLFTFSKSYCNFYIKTYFVVIVMLPYMIMSAIQWDGRTATANQHTE